MRQDANLQNLQDIERQISSRASRSAVAAILLMLIGVCLVLFRWKGSNQSVCPTDIVTQYIAVLSIACSAYAAIVGILLKRPNLKWATAYRKNMEDRSRREKELFVLNDEIDKLTEKSQFSLDKGTSESEESKVLKRRKEELSKKEKELEILEEELENLFQEYTGTLKTTASRVRRQSWTLTIAILFLFTSIAIGSFESMTTGCEPEKYSRIDSTFITNWSPTFDSTNNRLLRIAQAVESLGVSRIDTLHPRYVCCPCSTLEFSSDNTEKALNRIAQAIEDLVDSQTGKPVPTWIVYLFLWIGISLLVISSVKVYMLRNEASKRKATWELLRNLSLTSTLIGTLLSIDKFTVSIGDINICNSGAQTEVYPLQPSNIEFKYIGAIDSFVNGQSKIPSTSESDFESLINSLQDSNSTLLSIRVIGRVDMQELSDSLEQKIGSNENLARQRAMAVREAIKHRIPSISSDLFVIESDGADHVNSPSASQMALDRAVDVYVVRESIKK